MCQHQDQARSVLDVCKQIETEAQHDGLEQPQLDQSISDVAQLHQSAPLTPEEARTADASARSQEDMQGMYRFQSTQFGLRH